MALLNPFRISLVKLNFLTNISRNLRSSSILQLKEINVIEEKNKLVIGGLTVPSPREPYLIPEIKECGSNVCPECTLGLKIKHTDVLILSQYVRSDGCMLPRRITGLCKVQQKKIGIMVTMAQKAGLMPNLAPEKSKKDPKRRYQWKKFNKYFDEKTIKC